MKSTVLAMKVAVITPYYQPNKDWLITCHESVTRQTYPCTHIFVADGKPVDYIDKNAQHLILGHNHSDYGDTPRAVGSISAIRQGFDAIAYLDDDNWYYPQHIETLIAMHKKTSAPVCTSSRLLHRLDGSVLGPCPEVDGDQFVDVNCLFFTEKAFDLVTFWWSMPQQFHAIDDRYMWHMITTKGYPRAHTHTVTVAYRTPYQWHYRRFNEIPPPGTKVASDVRDALIALEDFKAKARP